MGLLILTAIVGCAVLVGGAELLVRGAASLGPRFGLSDAFIGLTVVAFGTSAPELFVNVRAAMTGHTAFALSNVAGSNLANICFGLCVCGLIGQVALPRAEFARELLQVTIAPAIVGIGLMLASDGLLSVWTSIPLCCLLLIYLRGLRKPDGAATPTDRSRPMALWKAISLLVAGILGLYFGAEFLLDAAVDLAHRWGLSESAIGLTVVAIGTSVPDIVTSVVATLRGENGIAVGNILGSNIMNVLAVLNSTLLVSGRNLPVEAGVDADYTAVIVVSALLTAVGIRSERIPRWFCSVMIVANVAFIVYRLNS